MKLTVTRALLLNALLFISIQLSAQSLYPISIDEKIQKSTMIVEGKVVQQSSFWNTEHTMIYTANTIELYKFFKGRVQEQTIEVVTTGGSIDGFSITASELLSLKKEETGIFFLMPNSKGFKSPKSKRVLFEVYSSSQGFIQYELHSNKAAAPFSNYDNIEDQLYKVLTSKLGKSYENVNPTFKVKKPQGAAQTFSHTISSFTPLIVNAGALLDPANNILTINGSGFGSGSGSAAVIFDNADDGSGNGYFAIPYDDPSILLWSDNQIRIQVPSEAGTGILSVSDAAGVVENFATPLTVNYSILNSGFNIGGTLYYKEQNLMNANGAGGYSIVYSTNTANSGIDINSHIAKSTFQRALNTWKETAGFALTEGGTTTSQAVASDGLNVVMFDNASTGQPALPAGVLGVCYSYVSMCGSAAYEAQRTGFDIVIRNPGYSLGTTSFTFGPCPPMASNASEVDLESVILHELGHAIGLGHINDGLEGSALPNINPGKLMNYAISNGVKRSTLDYSALAGARYLIQPQGNSYGACGLFASEMTPVSQTTESKDNCPIMFPSSAIVAGTTVTFDLLHATSNRFVDPAYTQVTCSGTGSSITNNAYYAFRTNGSGGALNLTVNNYSTSPAALTTCSPVYGYPVSGVKLALYQVNSCPSGQAFPAPSACRTFSANGSLSAINGLAANTNYLLFVDGIENTKSSFSLTFDGTIVLPLHITTFKGAVMDDHNGLTWTCDDIVNVEKLILQRSSNGIDFINIATFTNLNQIKQGFFKDFKATLGNNIYRLAVANTDHSLDYSSIINLKRTTQSFMTLYPNPAKDFVTIHFKNVINEAFTLKIYNHLGQTVIEKQLNNVQNLTIPIGHLAKGYYQAVIQKMGEMVDSYKFSIK